MSRFALLLEVRGFRGRVVCLAAMPTLLICLAVAASKLDLSEVGHKLTAPLERAVPVAVLGPGVPVAGIIALGGNFKRFELALDIAEEIPTARILISAGGLKKRTVALLLQRGIPEARSILETISTTTYENARVAADLLEPRPEQQWVLVTDAWHMPRAMAVFEAAGFRVLPAPLYHPGENPRMHSLEIALKEWSKLAFYRLMGRTPALLPRFCVSERIKDKGDAANTNCRDGLAMVDGRH
jgi:uncharacterized SAM-binding protein YcdF (DUF218 family)